MARFELTISWSQTKRDTGLRYTPNVKWEREYQGNILNSELLMSQSFQSDGDPAGTRTPNRQLRRLMLYPVELSDQTTRPCVNAYAGFVFKTGFPEPS